MLRFMGYLVGVGMALLVAGSAFAVEDLVDSMKEGCKKELETYCKGVTPGEGRVLACIYSRSDKLSEKCEYALYDAAVQLERAVNALAYVANECQTDLKSYCSAIQPGEGRLLACLDKNAKKVSARCKDALKEVKSK